MLYLLIILVCRVDSSRLYVHLSFSSMEGSSCQVIAKWDAHAPFGLVS
jgi:hypothetical protein